MQDAPQRVVTDLMCNLRDEVALFEDMRSILEEERVHLVDLDPVGLTRCTERKEALTLRHRMLEEARVGIAARMCLVDATLSADTPLSLISGAVGSLGLDPDGVLEQTRQRLTLLIDAVTEMNAINRRFVAHSILCVQGSMELLRRASEGTRGPLARTYGKAGRMEAVNDDAATLLRVAG